MFLSLTISNVPCPRLAQDEEIGNEVKKPIQAAVLPSGQTSMEATTSTQLPENVQVEADPEAASPAEIESEPATLMSARQEFFAISSCNMHANSATVSNASSVISNLESSSQWSNIPARYKLRVGCRSGSAVFAENTTNSPFSISNRMIASGGRVVIRGCGNGTSVNGTARGLWEYQGILIHVHGDRC